MFKKLHIHFFKTNHKEGNNVYLICRCGKRDHKSLEGGYSPLNRTWLNGGINA